MLITVYCERKITMNLWELKKGDSSFITGTDIDGNMRRRLQDIGFVNGSYVQCMGKSPLGDPSAYLVKGALIAVRQKEAKRIYVSE